MIRLTGRLVSQRNGVFLGRPANIERLQSRQAATFSRYVVPTFSYFSFHVYFFALRSTVVVFEMVQTGPTFPLRLTWVPEIQGKRVGQKKTIPFYYETHKAIIKPKSNEIYIYVCPNSVTETHSEPNGYLCMVLALKLFHLLSAIFFFFFLHYTSGFA